ncbi:helix-turn-helix domain-containing protein [Streptomyces sp. NBC_00704]|uniref:helix-turn-helix domain-containing protein n=1 Tax=Streptomyces sp. NBC_00704 TaxID=2975809 RepID=UPI002E343846|nr:helix-turn-helix domain-containing protein [Streptomyces sp. NBC_00704]
MKTRLTGLAFHGLNDRWISAAKVDEDVLIVARARKAKGESVSAIAKALGVSRATLYRHLGESA